jgi:DMSO/TMAO reductase YedYZ molybdopterin-dependent catalytic subunit
MSLKHTPPPHHIERRRFIREAAAGTALVALSGGLYHLASELLNQEAQAAQRPDGRRRLPPGQRLLQALKPMGGEPGNPSLSDYRLKVHGRVEAPFELDFRALAAMDPVELPLDVHCVTGWSVFDALFKGVRIRDLAARAKVLPSAKHVILEAAHGYTANVPLDVALHPENLVTWQLNGKRLAEAHGAPVRALIPERYFWKSAKWLTGIRFVDLDAPGYWETRGYHNRADPWNEERYG